MTNKEFDIIVWGATGFTGKLVAQYLFQRYQGTDLKWAMAGRDPAKLAATQTFCGDTEASISLVTANSFDKDSLIAMCQRTKVVISTVGPFAAYGSELVQVCAEQGTHYCDLTGEVPWMRRMINQHSDTAKNTGARIVHSCGFDSIPSDIGVFRLQQLAKEQIGQPLNTIQMYVLGAKGGFSGGTAHSLVNVVKEASDDRDTARLLRSYQALVDEPSEQAIRQSDQTGVVYDKQQNLWTMPFVMAGINTRIVHRSNSLMNFAYGEAFSYDETQSCGSGFKGRMTAYIGTAAIGAIMVGAKYKGSRKILENYILPKQGEGPKVDPNDPGFYSLKMVGTTQGGQSLSLSVKGDADPGYGSTCKMLAESAICLADYETPLNIEGGFWTPASSMGDTLRDRLESNAGLSFKQL